MTRKQWEDYNSRKEQLVIDGLFAQIAEQRMGTKRFLDDMDSIAKLTKERNRLREALIQAMPVLKACDCFDDPTRSYCVRCRVLDIVGEALKEVGDD